MSTNLSYATVSNPGLPSDIAVLGGGLTGLTTAYYLTRFHPDAKITVYESEARVGGWIDTEKVEVTTLGGTEETISFERGARVVSPQTTLTRYEDFVLYDLIADLKLVDESVALYRDDPVLSNRYVYYPDHLVRVPGNIPKDFFGRLGWFADVAHKILTEPIFTGLVRSHAISDLEDISMGEYFEGLLGRPDVVDNLQSALVHGIWGGDVWKLSMREGTFQQVLIQEKHGETPLIAVKDHDFYSGRDIAVRNEDAVLLASHFGPSVGYICFRNGFSTLTDSLANSLKRNPNVTIKTGNPVSSIRYEQGKAVVSAPEQAGGSGVGEAKYDKVISSLFSGSLAKLTGDSLPTLKNHSTAVTIQIVNLWYPDLNLNANHPGFGYLIPQSVPAENNPHAALGVIFDSDREAVANVPERQSAQGTKLTVMLGGHYWDYLDADSWPDAKEATAMAMDTVHRQLGIPPTQPVFTSTKVCRDCIPQHLVGHRERMAQAHTELYDAFRGTLAVVGSSYTPPGVLPSLKAGRDMALQVSGQGYKLKDGTEYDMVHVGQTGLARFAGRNETYRLRNRREIPYRFGNTAVAHDDGWPY
ncbi:putative protoporphyrinogen oxidase [Diaporthe ampelina]|uniref:Protoporphyrinogen oxidase n=1 Tax=Diaporthe ampelina TaxID=1214573 RepID=A0A0G2FDW9_9PEZI|nr:putative protoporphyrinogen oxidase [Diaporthe ampelina]